jgi:uptake hydrogenase large subunit
VISAGSLTVRATLAAGRLGNLDVDLRRPAVTQIFHGRAPETVVRTVPCLYAICAHAQKAAAQAALAVAADDERPAADDAALWVELLHENLWRLLLDWPPALGLPPEKEAFIAWRATRFGGNCADETKGLLANAFSGLAEKCLVKLVDRAGEETPRGGDTQLHATGVPPPLNPGEWLAGWREAGAAQPAPIVPSSIRTAYQGRVAEVERAAAALAAGAPYPIAVAGGDGWGVAQTATARGVLTHAVQLAAGKVARYRVWAPTDAFFADAVALSGLLAGRQFASPDEARQALDQAILALDPCVPYVLELNDA